MTMKQQAVMVLILSALVAGVFSYFALKNEAAADVEYQGIKRSRWIQLARDRDLDTSEKAYDALGHLPMNDESRKVLREGLRYGSFAAATALYDNSLVGDANDRELVIAAMKQKLRDDADHHIITVTELATYRYAFPLHLKRFVPEVEYAIKTVKKSGGYWSDFEIAKAEALADEFKKG